MEYTVACNWDPELLDQIDYPEVKSVFGGLPNTIIASGRPSLAIKNCTENEVRSYIKRVHDKGWTFDFNMNSTCLGNKEFTAEGRKEIMQYLEWVCSLGVDSLTISLPTLVEIVKKHFPSVKIKISTYQKINSVAMAQQFEEMGADALMLSEHVNRDFNLIEAIRKSVKCKLILVANVGCIYGCPNLFSHANSSSHGGTKGQKQSVFTEYYQLYCGLRRIKDPDELIKIRWIRPEDVSFYQELGVDMLKIIERNSATQALAERVKAYHDRCYKGNLLLILGQILNAKKTIHKNLKDELKPNSLVDLRKALKFSSDCLSLSLPELLYLDNTKIPFDFIKGFQNRNCASLSCKTCRYCHEVAEHCVSKVDPQVINSIMDSFIENKKEVVDGSILY